MIRRIVSTALHQPLLIVMLLVLFVAAGIAAFRSLPVEAFPDVTDVQVTVITLFPGHAPEEVEKQVTMPLEIGLSGLPNAVRMFSHTQFGLSYIILTFNDNATDYFARQQALERLQGVDLPDGVHPQLAPLSTAIGEIYRYRIQGKGMTPTDLRSMQDWVVSRNLKLIPGVADVVSFGGFIKRYEVTVNTARMKAYNVSLQQVFTALGRGNANAGGSFIEQGEQQYLIRGIGMLRSADDIGTVVVAEHGGTPLLIRDIAVVKIGAIPRQGLIGQDGEDEIVSGIVLMRKGENPSAGARRGQRTRRDPQRDDPAEGREARAVLRSLPPHRHHAQHGVPEPARGRAPRDGRVVSLPGQSPSGRDRRRHHPAVAAGHVHRPDDPGDSGEPAVARCDGLRHHRRRGRHRARERLPPPERAA